MGAFSWIEYLNDPHLVARIQEYFGVKTSLSQNRHKTSQTNRKYASQTTNILELPENNLHHRKRNPAKFLGTLEDLDDRSSSGSISSECDSGSSSISNLSTYDGENDANTNTNTTSGVSSNSDESDESTSQKLNLSEIIGNYWWYYLACFGSALGDEIFYACFFPFWFWNIDGAVCRRVVLIWGLLMYIGQSLKDIIRMPRPACPPCVRLEKKWELEYGLPSTHAIVASAVPFSVLYFTSTRYQYPFIYGLSVAIIWCALVCMSRIYLGMHSVLDILAGLSVVASLSGFVIPLVDYLDPILLKHQYGGIFLLLGGIALAVMSPGGDRWTPARGDTVVILGSCVGLNMGAWMNYQLGIIRGPSLDPPYPVIWPSYGMLGMSLLRLAIGLVVVYATKAIIKALGSLILKRVTRPSNTFSSVINCTRKEVFVELTYKFITYSSVSFNVVFLSPVVFRLIGIERPTFHTEI